MDTTKKQKNWLPLLVLALISLAFTSCQKTKDGGIEYVPFQETEEGQWGMISMDGKVLFKEEFKKRPTVVRDGRFFVCSEDGFWEMYEATEKPKKIGDEYAHASNFCNGRALVAVRNQPVSIIDTKGKEIKRLDKIDGKEVHGVRVFSEGYAIFMTTDSLWGAIDNDGKCVVKPEYCALNDCGDGKFIGVNNKYKKEFKGRGKRSVSDIVGNKDVKISVVNTSGKVLFDFYADKYEDFGYRFTDGKLAVSVKIDGKEAWGIINDKGETVVKPSAKLKDIGGISDDVFTYYNGDGWGLMNTKGETVIRAKYERLYIDTDNLLLAEVKDGKSYEYKFIDQKDNQVSEDTYLYAIRFNYFDGKHTFVKSSDKVFSIIDKDGKTLEGLPDIVSIALWDEEGYIESDYVNLNKFVEDLDITQDGIMGLTFKSTPQEAVKVEVKEGQARSDSDHGAGSPYWYDYTEAIDISKYIEGTTDVAIAVKFTGSLSRQTYRTERVIDYRIGNYYWYHDDKIPTGYVWNDVKPSEFRLLISGTGRLYGKLRDVYKALCGKFKSLGNVEKENSNATVIKLNNGKRALISIGDNKVRVEWGDLSSDIDISRFEHSEGSQNNDSTGNSDYCPADSTVCVCDTVAAW